MWTQLPPAVAALAAPCRRLHRAFLRSPFGRGWRRSVDVELWQQAMGFAALGFLTLVPLLIIVSAADPRNGRGFAEWLSQGLGVSEGPRRTVERLFARPAHALQTTTAFGIAALAVFGLTFGTAVQSGYEKVWELPPARWWARWRHLVWIAALTAYIFVVGTTVQRGSLPGALGVSLSSVLFFWWTQHILLSGRVPWGALLPGAVVTVVGLIGLRVFSLLVFSPLIASNAVTYGPVGTFLVLQSWLVGVGVVVFGGALVGRLLHEEIERAERAWRRRRARHRLHGGPRR